MQAKHNDYPIALSIDLRVFDNQQPDYGVRKFLDTLGFVPEYLFNHETYVGHIHSNDGVIDDTPLLPTWTAQRAVPGCQVWSRKQYYELIKVLHTYDIKFFQGAEAAWSVWPEYGELSRDTWIYNNLSELFVTYRNGATTEKEMGMICPLKHLKDGTLYEDMLLRDVLAFLDDYDADGFFAADGFGGLATQLEDGDYSDDMVAQFTEHTGIQVKGNTITERADDIWEHYRYEWADFYSDRWAAFYQKLVPAFEQAGKELIVMAPFKHGPADAFLKYGYDYAKNARAGLKCYALESMETNSHRWQNFQSMEAVGITNAITIKAVAPDTKIMWMSATCNAPEHWHTLRDHPGMLERECIALNTARCVGPDGELIPSYDGVQPLFGIDLSASEWRWYKERLDIGHKKIAHNDGLVLIWSDSFLYEHAKRNQIYPLTFESAFLRFSGLPIHSSVNLDNIQNVSNRSLLLIEPLGITDEQVASLRDLVVNGGKTLIVVGEVENQALLDLLGLSKDGTCGSQWELTDRSIYDSRIPSESGTTEENLGGYQAAEARSLIDVKQDGQVIGTGLSVRAYPSEGNAVYIRRIHRSFPAVQHMHSEFDTVCHPHTSGKEPSGLTTIREIMQGVALIHPDSYGLLVSRFVCKLDGTFPYSNIGQVLSCTDQEGTQYLFCENPLNAQYTYMTVTLPYEKKYIAELPIRRNGGLGYQYYGDPRPNKMDVCVPPEALIPFTVEYKNSTRKEAK